MSGRRVQQRALVVEHPPMPADESPQGAAVGGTAAGVAEESHEHHTRRDLVSLNFDGLNGIPSITVYQVRNDVLLRS